MKSMSPTRPDSRPAGWQRGAGGCRPAFAGLALAAPKPRRVLACARRQGGFAIVTAIFLLVVLAALGAFMVTLSSVQHTTSAQDVQGSRAYHAARAGIEWGIYQIMTPENAYPFVPATRATCANVPAPVPPAGNLVLGGTLNGFTVSVTCSGGTDVIEGDNTLRVFTLTSNASTGVVGSTGYVEREISATVMTCRKTADGAHC